MGLTIKRESTITRAIFRTNARIYRRRGIFLVSQYVISGCIFQAGIFISGQALVLLPTLHLSSKMKKWAKLGFLKTRTTLFLNFKETIISPTFFQRSLTTNCDNL